MDLTNKEVIINLAKKNDISPSRQSGQNFLISRHYLEEIVGIANLDKDDRVMEIGPGFGVLTLELLKHSGQVVSFEIDKKLFKYLERYLKLYPNFKLHNADAIKNWKIINEELKDLDYKLVSNLPYNITSRVLRNFTELKPRPKEMIIMVQKEVAERVVAKPGQMSILSVAVQFYGHPEKMIDIKSENFWPEPAIDSSILKISQIGMDARNYQKKLSPFKAKDFFRTVKIGFSARRKQLHNNLVNGFKITSEKTSKTLAKNGINPKIRAQELSIDQWIDITRDIAD